MHAHVHKGSRECVQPYIFGRFPWVKVNQPFGTVWNYLTQTLCVGWALGPAFYCPGRLRCWTIIPDFSYCFLISSIWEPAITAERHFCVHFHSNGPDMLNDPITTNKFSQTANWKWGWRKAAAGLAVKAHAGASDHHDVILIHWHLDWFNLACFVFLVCLFILITCMHTDTHENNTHSLNTAQYIKSQPVVVCVYEKRKDVINSGHMLDRLYNATSTSSSTELQACVTVITDDDHLPICTQSK